MLSWWPVNRYTALAVAVVLTPNDCHGSLIGLLRYVRGLCVCACRMCASAHAPRVCAGRRARAKKTLRLWGWIVNHRRLLSVHPVSLGRLPCWASVPVAWLMHVRRGSYSGIPDFERACSPFGPVAFHHSSPLSHTIQHDATPNLPRDFPPPYVYAHAGALGVARDAWRMRLATKSFLY